MGSVQKGGGCMHSCERGVQSDISTSSPPLIHESRFDLDDRHATRIILGRMLRIVMKSRKKLHCAAAGMLADQILKRSHDLAKAHTSEGMAITRTGVHQQSWPVPTKGARQDAHLQELARLNPTSVHRWLRFGAHTELDCHAVSAR
jgi:hypothetical protein